MAMITEVERVRSRVKIRLDDGSRYQLSIAAYLDRPVRVDEEVDPAEYDNWVTMHQYRPALDQAVSMLAARSRSREEIRQKLRTVGYSESTIEMVLCKLETNHLLNDQEFGNQWARYRAGQKYGPRRIQQELRAKGLSQEETEEALGQLDEEEQLEQAVELARKGFERAKPEEDPRKTLNRVMNALVRRGYDWDTTRAACEKCIQIEE